MIILPEFNKIALDLGYIKIHWYGLAYCIGIILAVLIISNKENKYHFFAKNIKQYNHSLSKHSMLEKFYTYIIIGVILGGRIGYIVFYNLSFYINNMIEIIKIWHGGMSFHGAMIGMIIAIFIFAKKYKISFFNLSDLICYSVGPGIFLGRLANFINQELVGKPSNIWWSVKYSDEIISRHPSQLYEGIFEGLIPFIILAILESKFNILNKPKLVSAIFLIFYGTARFIIEFFRMPDSQIGYLGTYFNLGHLLCLMMILLGILILNIKTKNS